jgi:hypothetical protein
MHGESPRLANKLNHYIFQTWSIWSGCHGKTIILFFIFFKIEIKNRKISLLITKLSCIKYNFLIAPRPLLCLCMEPYFYLNITRLQSRAVFNTILGAQSGRTWALGAQNCLNILRCACSSAPWKSWKGWGMPSSHMYLPIPVRLPSM